MAQHQKELRIYFAHSKLSYGSSKEKEELQFLRKTFIKSTIIDPNSDVGELRNFNEYLKIVDSCSQVVVSEYKECVGRGVFSEIARGFANGTPISVLRKQANKYILFQVIGIEIVNQIDWKRMFGNLIVKT